MRLFERLLELLFPSRPTERLVRTATPDHLAARVHPSQVGTSITLLPYREALVHAAIVEAKFYGNEQAQKLLGNVLAEHLIEELGEDAPLRGSRAVLVPIPLGRGRRHERGYNQSERICEEAMPRLHDLAHIDAGILSRVRDTAPQTSLDGAMRHANMQGAFSARRGLDTSLLYIVIDDVATTGATLSAAAAALREAGCSRVASLALAH